ncbi:MAG: regulatory protein RecX [Bacteroidota bacterium]
MNKPFLQKIAAFCAYQERTHNEVRERLFDWSIRGDDAEEMIVWLIENNYLNEERFAKAFAGGKFRMKNWGRIRIKHELKMKGLSDYCIKIGLAEIDENDYFESIKKMINRKANKDDFENPYLRKHKLARYIIGKGYEQQLVWRFLGEEN